MVKTSRLAIVFVLSFVLLSVGVFAQPKEIAIQGRLLDSQNGPITSNVSMNFSLYNVSTGGAVLYTENHPIVEVKNGVWNAKLGSITPLELPFDEQYYLETAVNNEILSPRIALTSAPYSFALSKFINLFTLGGIPLLFTDLLNGRIGIGTTNPLAQLHVIGDIITTGKVDAGNLTTAGNINANGYLIRRIARVHGVNWNDGTDNGPISTRVLTFVKTQNDTGIRASYEDNLRATDPSGITSCRWEIKFNGNSCTNPGPIAFDQYSGNTGDNDHRGKANFGTCFGLPTGTYTIQVYVGPTPGFATADCYTGWSGQYWALEAEEVR